MVLTKLIDIEKQLFKIDKNSDVVYKIFSKTFSPEGTTIRVKDIESENMLTLPEDYYVLRLEENEKIYLKEGTDG